MPSLDGYSLNEEIQKLRVEVFEELTSMRESFRELYSYIANDNHSHLYSYIFILLYFFK